ncbi:Uncharacterised protein [Mycobacteroides abscessus subsp. abscessus]|nr:Uncharacterised protein [Mycobacteroides abscessus subsp. abscessus]
MVTATTGPASASTKVSRASGTAGSIGRYAAPVLRIPKIAAIASADRLLSSATTCPGPAPRPINKYANRFAAESSSR